MKTRFRSWLCSGNIRHSYWMSEPYFYFPPFSVEFKTSSRSCFSKCHMRMDAIHPLEISFRVQLIRLCDSTSINFTADAHTSCLKKIISIEQYTSYPKSHIQANAESFFDILVENIPTHLFAWWYDSHLLEHGRRWSYRFTLISIESIVSSTSNRREWSAWWSGLVIFGLKVFVTIISILPGIQLLSWEKVSNPSTTEAWVQITSWKKDYLLHRVLQAWY